MDICVDAGGICLVISMISLIVWMICGVRSDWDITFTTVIPCALTIVLFAIATPLHIGVGKVKICHVTTKKEVAAQQEAQRATIRKAYLELSKEGASNESKEDSIRQAD